MEPLLVIFVELLIYLMACVFRYRAQFVIYALVTWLAENLADRAVYLQFVILCVSPGLTARDVLKVQGDECFNSS